MDFKLRPGRTVYLVAIMAAAVYFYSWPAAFLIFLSTIDIESNA